MNFTLSKQVLDLNDTLYIVKCTIKTKHIKEEYVNEYKECIMCDTVLKKDDLYYFCQKIQEAEVIEYLYETK